MEREYIAFISYRHAPLDTAVAGTLHAALEQYRIPKALRKEGKSRLGLIFRDQEELPVSSDLSADIRTALDHSRFLIVVCSPGAVASPWVNREIDYFMEHHDRERVLTVLADGEPQEAFPQALTRVALPDGSARDVEPLAVDVRAGDRRTALRYLHKRLPKLIAALIGCSYDELVMREQRRQRRRAAAVFSAAMAVALCFCGLLLFKNRQIDQKNLELETANLALENKNLELEQQKAAVLLRESELLTAGAEEALARGDRAGAIRLAVSALPGAEERPYYGPAEGALLSALDLFGESRDGRFILSTRLEQSAPIEDFRVSADGSVLAAIDSYGTVNAFRTSGGEALWSAQLGEWGASYTDSGAAVCFCGPINAFLCRYRETLAACSAADGALLWETVVEGTGSSALFLTEDQSRLAYLERRYIPAGGSSEGSYAYSVVFLSTADGAEAGRCLIAAGSGDQAGIALPDGVDGAFGLRPGAFSEDGRTFAGCFYAGEPFQEGCTLYYYIADLEEGSCRIVYSQYLEDTSYYAGRVLSLTFADGGASLLAARSDGEYYPSVTLEKIRLEDGTLLWRSVSTPSETGYFLEDPIGRTAVSGDLACVSCGDQIFAFDIQGGGFLCGVTMSGDVIALEAVNGEGLFVCALSDGSSIVFRRGDGEEPSLTGLSWTVADLQQDTEMAGFWGDAFLSADFSEEGRQKTVGCFAVTRSEGDGHALILRSVRPAGGLPQPEKIAHSCEGEGLYHTDVTLCPNGNIVVGAFSLPEGCGYVVLDGTTLEQIGETVPGSALFSDHTYFLPDASGYILQDYDGLSRYDIASGGQTVLAENEQVVLVQTERGAFIASRYVFASALQSAGGHVLSAQCGGEELRLWLDGAEQEAVPLPEDLRWSVTDGPVYRRVLQAGGNGYILLSHFDDENSAAMSGFAAYDTAAGVWTRFADEAAGSSERLLCMGATAPLLCVADEDGCLRTYDMAAGALQYTMSLPVPVRSLEQLELLLDDTVLLLLTQDGQVFLYDIASGELLLREQVDMASSSRISAYVDEEGRRLYLVLDEDQKGYLIDLTSWTKLMEVPDMLCYLPRSGLILRCTYSEDLTACRLPRTGELIELGTGLIS